VLGVVARDEKPTEDPLFVRDAAYVQKKNTKYECRDTVCMCTLYSGIDVYKEEHIGDTHTCIHMDTAMHTERCL